MTTAAVEAIDFALPDDRWVTLPPERRARGRDDVRLMVADRTSGRVHHHTFTDLADLLKAGDVVVVNVSATVPAALDAWTHSDEHLRLHLSSPAAEGLWSLEVRTPNGWGSEPGPDLAPQDLRLEGDGVARLLARSPRSPRLWIAALEGTGDLDRYLDRHGTPVGYAPGRRWPLSFHQTIFATEGGSAEMPSAARPFTHELVTRLVSRGVVILPVLLHTGVSSFELDETPGDERFRVPAVTARVANSLRDAGGRLFAVGTSTVRALETVTEPDGTIHPGEGVTDTVVTPERGVRAVDGLLTGWHEPRSSHLSLLEAVAGRDLLRHCYDQALDGGYLWHEFGDSLLISP